MQHKLEKQMEFIIEIDKMKNIFRQNYICDGSRRENDAEHSWHLAMLVITLSEYFENVNILKSLKMVLIHDLVEIYAGDTFAYDEKANLDKAERENESSEKLFSILPTDQKDEFIKLWKEFEKIDTPESILANICDRIQPLILNVTSKGKSWIDKKVTVDKVLSRNKIIFDMAPKPISSYVKNLIENAQKNNYLWNE
jgi:putative hydrolase of HD superfamily